MMKTNVRLQRIQDWLAIAKQVDWSVSKMAEHCGVSESTLRRHYFQHLGKSPRSWLATERLKQPR